MTTARDVFAAIGFCSVFVTTVLLCVTAAFEFMEWLEDRRRSRISDPEVWLRLYGKRWPR